MEDIIRDLKIDLILKDNIKISHNRLKYISDNTKWFTSKCYEALKSNPNLILSGSYALYVYGILNRKPNDYDVIINEVDVKLYNLIPNYSYFPDEKDVNSIGKTEQNGISLDMFLNEDNVDYVVYDGIKIATPEYILSKKASMNRTKDHKDFAEIKEILKNM